MRGSGRGPHEVLAGELAVVEVRVLVPGGPPPLGGVSVDLVHSPHVVDEVLVGVGPGSSGEGVAHGRGPIIELRRLGYK